MAITKYGIGPCYCSWGRGNSTISFCSSSVQIYACSDKTSTIYSEVSSHGEEQCCEQNTLVVQDDSGVWREYFSGRIVRVVSEDFHGFLAQKFNADSTEPLWYGLTVYCVRECTATVFADEIAKFSDEEIKAKVQRLRALEAEAAKWGKEVESAIEEVRAERARKEAGISDAEAMIEAKFGKYDDILADEKQKPSNNQRLQWIREKRCSFCGGEFRGLFHKVCQKCGKDY